MFHNKRLVEEKGDEVLIRDMFVTNEKKYLTNVLLVILIKDIKKTKVRIKHGILVDFHTVETINTDGNKMVRLKNYL